MKTAREIIKKHTSLRSGSTFIGIHEAMKEYAFEVAKESLKNAGENAKLWVDGEEEEFYTVFGDGGCSSVSISEQSILNESNIPKLD